jgi:hypothetical protein
MRGRHTRSKICTLESCGIFLCDSPYGANHPRNQVALPHDISNPLFPSFGKVRTELATLGGGDGEWRWRQAASPAGDGDVDALLVLGVEVSFSPERNAPQPEVILLSWARLAVAPEKEYEAGAHFLSVRVHSDASPVRVATGAHRHRHPHPTGLGGESRSHRCTCDSTGPRACGERCRPS